MTETPTRFIAGAVCPACGAMDKVRMFKRDGELYRDCVACSHEEKMEESSGHGVSADSSYVDGSGLIGSDKPS